MSISLVILAAGRSSRFNGIKQLADIKGISMVNFKIKTLQTLNIGTIHVALGAHIEKILNTLPLSVTPIITENWQLGLGHTISEVVSKIANTSEYILFCPADQVLIAAEHYKNLITASHKFPNKIIASISDHKIMAPAIFPKQFFNELMQLTADRGANGLFKKYHEQLVTITCENAKFDIDTQEDYSVIKQKLTQELKTNQPEQV